MLVTTLRFTAPQVTGPIVACQIFAQGKKRVLKCFPIAHSYPNIVIGNLYPKDIG